MAPRQRADLFSTKPVGALGSNDDLATMPVGALGFNGADEARAVGGRRRKPGLLRHLASTRQMRLELSAAGAAREINTKNMLRAEVRMKKMKRAPYAIEN